MVRGLYVRDAATPRSARPGRWSVHSRGHDRSSPVVPEVSPMRKLAALLVSAACCSPALVPAPGAPPRRQPSSGTLREQGRVALGPDAVAMITIVDQQASPDAGAIIGHSASTTRQLPLAFSVTYDDGEIIPRHSYAMFASVNDGDTDAPERGAGAGDHRRTDIGRDRGRDPVVRGRRPPTVDGTITRTRRDRARPGAVAIRGARSTRPPERMVARQAIPSPARARSRSRSTSTRASIDPR